MSDEKIADESALRARYAEPSEIVKRKQLDRLDVHCRAIIAHSPFLVLATAGADGTVDASPRGDAPGFVKAIDDRTLMLPDRRRNNRLDSLANVLGNPEVGMIFFVPGLGETLRVNGRAEIVTDAAVLDGMAVAGKPPTSALRIAVREAYLHCAKAVIRAKLWSDDYKIDRSAFPSLGRMVAEQVGADDRVEEFDRAIEESYRTRLY